jgi:tetratricopeptide (TPR) repeat protein
MKRGWFCISAIVAISFSTAIASAAPILIPGIKEPPELRVEPFTPKKTELSAPDRMMGEIIKTLNAKNLALSLPALNQLLAQYPDYADGYTFRVGALCEAANDTNAISSDLTSAIRLIDQSSTEKDSFVSLQAMQAKMEFQRGNFAGALDLLERAVASDPKQATQFVNSGGVKPRDKETSICVWTQSDMNELVRRFPNDYRAYMVRGLYYSFF